MGGARGGLASHGVAPAVLSGAALGHDRVRDGSGWGQRALGHGHPPPGHGGRAAGASSGIGIGRGVGSRPSADVRRPTRHRCWGVWCGWRPGPVPLARPGPGSSPARCLVRLVASVTTQGPGPGVGTRRRDHARHGSREETSSAIRTAPLRSVARRPRAAYRPGRLPGASPGSMARRGARLGEGFPLRCFQRLARPDVATQPRRSPDDWPTSGPSIPVLSY